MTAPAPAPSPAPSSPPGRPLWERVTCFPFIVGIRLYQVTLAALTGGQCRFTPTCSNYGLEAFQTLPPHRAIILTTWRILRCHPLGGKGYDPVPMRDSGRPPTGKRSE